MKQNKPTPRFWGQLAVLLVLYWSIIGLSYHYIDVAPQGPKASGFYKTIPFSQIHMTENRLQQIMQDGAMTEFESMMVVSAFRRFQLDAGIGGTFDKYMASYEKGFWNIPKPDFWRQVFTKHRNEWEEMRRKYKQRGVSNSNLFSVPEGRQIIQFRPDTPTYMIGSKFKLIVAAPSTQVFEQPAQVAWATIGPGGQTLRGYNPGRWELDSRTSGSLVVGRLHVDLSGEPQWLGKNQQAGSVAIAGTDSKRWNILGIQVLD